MAATHDSGQGYGSQGSPQSSIDELIYEEKVNLNENAVKSEQKERNPVYVPSPKHVPGSGWGSDNPVKSQAEGQRLLDTGYKSGKQIYNIADNGKIVKFQPDNSPDNGYHSYEVSKPRDIPPSILKKLYEDNKITKSEYLKFIKGKK